MLIKPITFRDLFTDEERTEEFYFHLTRSELIELEVRFDGGLEQGILRIVQAQDNETLVQEFKRIILLAVGRKEGPSFNKSKEVKDWFAGHPAFDELFMSMLNDEGVAAEFVNGIMPKNASGEGTATEAKAAMEKAAAEKAAPKKLELPPQPPLPPSA